MQRERHTMDMVPPVNVDGEHQVKNSVSREQQPADPATWMPGKGK